MGYVHTLTNLRANGECVVNIVSAALAEAMNATCADYPPEVDELQAVGLERAPSQMVAPKSVKAAQVRLACRLHSVIEVSAAPPGGTIMLLDVVGIHVNDTVMHGQLIAPDLLDAVGKLGGDAYATTPERFELARPVLV